MSVRSPHVEGVTQYNDVPLRDKFHFHVNIFVVVVLLLQHGRCEHTLRVMS